MLAGGREERERKEFEQSGSQKGCTSWNPLLLQVLFFFNSSSSSISREALKPLLLMLTTLLLLKAFLFLFKPLLLDPALLKPD